FLHREPVDVDCGARVVARKNFEDAPDAGIAAVVGVAKRDQIDFLALGLLEMPTVREGLERHGQRRTDFLALGPFDLRTHVFLSTILIKAISTARAASSPPKGRVDSAVAATLAQTQTTKKPPMMAS